MLDAHTAILLGMTVVKFAIRGMYDKPMLRKEVTEQHRRRQVRLE